MKTNMTKKQKGICLMLLSVFLFSAMQIVVNLTGTFPLMEQVFFRNIVSVIMCFFLIKRNGSSFFGKRENQPLLFMRSIFGFIGLLALFYAASNGNQADITILSKLSPFLITLFAFLFLKEKIARIQVPALAIAFSGVIFVANPAFQTNLTPLAAAFACSIFSGITFTLLAYSKDKEDVLTVVMHFSSFCVIACFPFMMVNFVVPSLREFLLLTLIGIFGSLGQVLLTSAYRMAPAAEVSIYHYMGIVFSAIMGYFILGEHVSLTSLLGGGLVIIASLLTYRFSSREVNESA